MATDNDNVIYYEQGTGAWGDGRQVLFAAAPDADTDLGSDEEVWEYVNDAATVSFEDIVETLRQVRDRSGDYLGAVDSLLDILDPVE